MLTTAIDRVTEALYAHGCEQKGKDWVCPAHPDNDPSLSVSEGDSGVVLFCHAGCSVESIIATLGLKMADLFDSPVTKTRKIVETYSYRDESGSELFQVVRMEPKDFRQRRPDGAGGWLWSLNGTRRVLYRLPDVLTAISAGEIIVIVEGEKDADALWARGIAATCNPGGAGKWRAEYAEVLRDAKTLVCADKDAAGRKHAESVADSLRRPDGSKPLIVEPLVGKDIFDHLAAGYSVEELVPLSVSEGAIELADHIRAVEFTALDVSKPPDPPRLLTRWLYEGRMHVLKSEPGEGKTWIALAQAIEVMESGKTVMYLDEEGGEDLIRQRLYTLEVDPDLIDKYFRYVAFDGRSWSDDDILAYRAKIAELRAAGHVIALVIFDSLPDFLQAAGLSEDSAGDVTGFVRRVLGLFREFGIAQLLLDHDIKQKAVTTKERSRYSRGSGAKLAKADVAILLETATPFDANKSGALRFWKTKDRLGALSLPQLSEPALVLAADVNPSLQTLSFREMAGVEADLERAYESSIEVEALVLDELERAGAPLSGREIEARVPGRASRVREALLTLSQRGTITKSIRSGRGGGVVWGLLSDEDVG